MGREILDAAARAIRPGITTDEIDAIVHKATIEAGKKSSFCFLPWIIYICHMLNYFCFIFDQQEDIHHH